MNEDHNNDFVRFRTVSVYELLHDVMWIYGELETFQEASLLLLICLALFLFYSLYFRL